MHGNLPTNPDRQITSRHTSHIITFARKHFYAYYSFLLCSDGSGLVIPVNLMDDPRRIDFLMRNSLDVYKTKA
jgi:hypothetical protein